MAKVDPFIIPLPAKLGQDPQLRGYFQYLQKFLHDLWVRTGAGADDIEGAAHLVGDQTFSGDQTFTGVFNLSGTTLFVDGVQVVGPQQAAIADAAAATATNPAPPTAYVPHSSGGITVTSNSATDLDSTAAALKTLRDEVESYETAISALIVDVADIRAALNDLLATERTHGLIDT